MKDKKTILIVLILIVAFGAIIGLFYLKNKNVSPVEKVDTSLSSLVTYDNSDYGFTFSLPDNWKGYTVVKNTWQGSPLNKTKAESGPKLLIRNPKWTEALHYEDIPIMIFTLAQWNSYRDDNFAVGAAPISASELGRNNTYVFALPARWNFDYSQGYVDAENILKGNPLKAYDISKISILKDGEQCYTYNHKGTVDEPYTVSEFIDITINGVKVSGVKNGTQNGPDMTNGYEGTFEGTTDGNTINGTFSYSIEGSKNKEQEIYKAREDQLGIEKLRYPLVEKGGLLVPDTTKSFTALLYSRVGCAASN